MLQLPLSHDFMGILRKSHVFQFDAYPREPLLTWVLLQLFTVFSAVHQW